VGVATRSRDAGDDCASRRDNFSSSKRPQGLDLSWRLLLLLLQLLMLLCASICFANTRRRASSTGRGRSDTQRYI